jgi:zinc transport system substrate-binding protein
MVGMRSLLPAVGVTVLAAVASCGGGDSADGAALRVYTTLDSVDWLVEEVGRSRVEVESLIDPGTDPHHVELSPRQVGELSEADLAVVISGMQPAVEEALAQHEDVEVYDIADVVELREASADEGGGLDPHVWLDAGRFAEAAEGLAERLAEIDPEGAADYEEHGAATVEELQAIDEAYSSALADCAEREFVVTHAAFGYLAERYDLEQIAITGIEPDSEPSPARIREVADLVQERGIDTVFLETLADEQVGEVLAEEAGAQTAILDPLESITERSPADDYPGIMDANREALAEALECE